MRCGLVSSLQKRSSDWSEFSWSKSPLIQLLRTCFQSQATDPRDRVYGLLGLSLEAEEPFLQPNYEEHEDLLFIRVAKYVVETGCGPLLFDCIPNLRESPSWPSWVPRWDINEVARTFMLDPVMRPNPIFTAAGESRQAFRYQQDGQRQTLLVRGIVLDSIQGFLGSPSRYFEQHNNPAEYDHWAIFVVLNLFEAHKLMNNCYGYRHLKGQRVIDILYRLAVCDMKHRTSQRAPREYENGLVILFATFARHYLMRWQQEGHASVDVRAMIVFIIVVMQGASFPTITNEGMQCCYEFLEAAGYSLGRLVRFNTHRGYLGQVHPIAREGDKIAIIAGVKNPL